jgi:hypothetical protein
LQEKNQVQNHPDNRSKKKEQNNIKKNVAIEPEVLKQNTVSEDDQGRESENNEENITGLSEEEMIHLVRKLYRYL